MTGAAILQAGVHQMISCISRLELRSCAVIAKLIASRSEASRISGAGLGEGEVAPGACAILRWRSSRELSTCSI